MYLNFFIIPFQAFCAILRYMWIDVVELYFKDMLIRLQMSDTVWSMIIMSYQNTVRWGQDILMVVLWLYYPVGYLIYNVDFSYNEKSEHSKVLNTYKVYLISLMNLTRVFIIYQWLLYFLLKAIVMIIITFLLWGTYILKFSLSSKIYLVFSKIKELTNKFKVTKLLDY